MYPSTETKKFLGIADTKWPECAPIEKMALALGYEAVISTQIEGLTRQKNLGIVVTELAVGSSLEVMLTSIRSFSDDVHFVIRVDASDSQT